MVKRILLMAVALTLVFGGVIGFKLFKQAKIREYLGNMGVAPVHLTAARVEASSWQQQLAAIGSLRAREGIDIRSEVEGVVHRVHVQPGQRVKAGDLLVELDDTVDRAVLKSARVRLEKTRRDFQRDKALFEKALISRDEFENARSEFESAEALVEETQGVIERKTLRAPFDGTVGIHNLAEGHYLGKGDDVLSLQALQTLYLDMNVPEKDVHKLRPGQRVQFSVPSQGEQVFDATVRFIDVRVEATTRNVLIRAMVENPERILLPGMFARATIILEESRQVLTVPREAVAYSLFGETVYVLRERRDESGSAESAWAAYPQTVVSGEVREGRIEVTGLEAGQLIGLDSQQRLLEGSPVVIVNTDILDASTDNPDNSKTPVESGTASQPVPAEEAG